MLAFDVHLDPELLDIIQAPVHSDDVANPASFVGGRVGSHVPSCAAYKQAISR
jgi:hypothetical protein